MTERSAFQFAPGVALEISGPRGDVAQFELEYGPCRLTEVEAPGNVPLVVSFGPGGAGGSDVTLRGGHKTVGWRITVSPADAHPTTMRVDLRGLPRSFARSLVQGYFIEPMLSVVAAEAGQVLLPSAGIVTSEGLHVLIGQSRSGKSTVAARSLASGRRLIGDDQVLVDAAGSWRPYPRRLRFYPDLRHTAPGAWEALRPATRSRLRGRAAVAAITRGFVRPSLAVDAAELGGRWDPSPAPAVRLLLLERSPAISALSLEDGDLERALDRSAEVLASQRAGIRALPDERWLARLDAVSAAERQILEAALAGLPVSVVRVPARWEAPRAVNAIATELGV